MIVTATLAVLLLAGSTQGLESWCAGHVRHIDQFANAQAAGAYINHLAALRPEKFPEWYRTMLDEMMEMHFSERGGAYSHCVEVAARYWGRDA